MPADYFSDALYRDVIGDTTSPLRADEAAVERAQAEVVNRLEAWARTSWVERTTTEVFRVDRPEIGLGFGPITTVDAATLDGSALSVVDTILGPGGVLRWAAFDDPFVFPAAVTVTYTYGRAYAVDDIPMEILVPMIHATASRAERMGPNGETKLPPNTTSYTVAGTTVNMDPALDAAPVMPWPWDTSASRDIRGAVHPPRRFLSAAR